MLASAKKNSWDLTTILIPFVYFIAGATSLASIAATFFYKDELGLSVAQTQLLAGLVILPWSVKPLYGLLSDSTPIFGLRRKPYLFLSGLLGSAGYFSMAFFVTGWWGALFAILISNAGFALADVIVDGIVAERSRTQQIAGKLQTYCRAGVLGGALVVSYLSGILVELIGPRNVYLITAFLPLLTTALSLFLIEKQAEAVKGVIKDLVKTVRHAFSPAILWSIAFLLIWRSTPSFGTAYNFFLIDEFGFGPEFFGRLALISHGMSIAGVLVFRKYLVSIPLNTLFFWTIVAATVLSLPTLVLVYGWHIYLGISPKFFSMADTFISAPMSEIAYIPLLVLVARICPKGVEATMFALLASIMNIGLAIGDFLGAGLATWLGVTQGSYGNLHWLLWIAILSSLLPLPLVSLLPDTEATAIPKDTALYGAQTQIEESIEIGKGTAI